MWNVEPLKSFFLSRGTPSYKIENKTKRQLVAHGDYSCVAGRQTEIPAIFGVVYGIYRIILIFIYLFHDFSRNYD